MDARPIDAFRDQPAVVVAPVPEVGDGRSPLPPAPRELADDVSVAVDDLEVDAVGASETEANRRSGGRAVAGGSERLVDDRGDDRVPRQLQLLGDGEGDGGRDEQRGDEKARRETGPHGGGRVWVSERPATTAWRL